MLTTSEVLQTLSEGRVLVNIGQIDKATRRELDKLVRKGEAVCWRGYWFPVAGASWGMGPLKTCWALCERNERVLAGTAQRTTPPCTE